ncbi:MAG: hypothetical protein Q9191_000219 [Dirinaria sp. TL-2023a]
MSRRKRQRLTIDGPDFVTLSEPAEAQIEPSIVSERTRKPNATSKTLFVHSLGVDTTTKTLTEHFSQRYPLKHATVVIDPVTKKSKGYGFVTFADADDARDAKDSLKASIIDDREIKLDLAEARHRRLGDHTGTLNDGGSISKTSQDRQKIGFQNPTKLIIRNLPWSVNNSNKLANLFKIYGKIKFATIPKKRSGLSAGFGFVTFRSRKNAEKALQQVNGKETEGRTLAVDWAVEKNAWNILQHQQIPEVGSAGTSVAESDNAEDLSVASRGSQNSVTSSDSISDLYKERLDRQYSIGQHSTFGAEALSFLDDTKIENADGRKACDNSSTLFIRNVPFSATDAVLQGHFSSFGPVRYARVVLDSATGRSRGSAFVAFYKSPDADICLRGSPRVSASGNGNATSKTKPSILEDSQLDPGGRYTLEGRVLSVSRAVDRSEAHRLMMVGSLLREERENDKRHLYLLSEGTVSPETALYNKLSPMERKLREDSAQQRQALIKSNPTLHVSLTRLSVRNLPRTVTSKDLKGVARKAVVGFAEDVKAGKRQQLSKEELARGGEASRLAEKARKAKGKGIVRQAKIVFEGVEGSKVQESSGAGRSRGYGFVEYTSHRWALMGLRWLNGHIFNSQNPGQGSQEQKKRLVVEFAIENAQVVARRQDREAKAQNTPEFPEGNGKHPRSPVHASKNAKRLNVAAGWKERQVPVAKAHQSFPNHTGPGRSNALYSHELTKRQHVIGRKRMMRKARKRE